MHGTRTRSGVGFAMVLAIVLAGGCASLAGGDPDPAYATVVVDNDSPLMVTISTIRQSSRFRLGTVPGLTRKEFPIKKHMLDNASFLQLLISPLGGQMHYHTDRIVVDPGDQVRLRVSNFIR